ncbi:MAG: c-type cytochrome [Thermoanaerobaculia bacterium]
MRYRFWLAPLVAVLLLIVVTLPLTRWVLMRRELNPILRGRLLAEQQGCTTCHWSYSQGEIPNPGSRWGSVPRFAAGNAAMYAEDPTQIEEFIRFGAPRSWLQSAKVAERLNRQHLRMPAFEASLTDAEIDDLVAFTAAVERVDPVDPSDPVASEAMTAARDLARASGCTACHGVEGSGGLPNPGSLGGFVPGFLGGNFPDMVRDVAEFRQWVVEGTSHRLERNPVIGFFWKRQKISMPSYGEQLSEDQIDQLWEWIQAMRSTAADSS